jgi:hypothetical protein
VSACKRCGRPILWACREQRAPDGKRVWVPLDPEPDPCGIVELSADKTAVFAGPSMDPKSVRYTPHEASCGANAHNNRKREKVT